MEQKFYTISEVAKMLKVDPMTIRRYIKAGKIKAIKPTINVVRISEKDLNEFLEKSKVK